MQRGSAPILFLLAGLIILGGVLYLNKFTLPVDQISPQSENKYSTYTNQQLDFEFKYPRELIIKEDSESEFNKRGNGDFRKNFKGYVGFEPGKFVGGILVLDKDLNYDTNPLAVWVFDNPDDLSIEKWYGKFWYYPFVWGDFTSTGKSTVAPKDEATISGQIGKVGVVNYQPGKPKFIYLSDNKKMYLLRIIGNLGDQVLSNFKLLKLDTKNVDGCKIGGCSSQLCVEEGQTGVSTCEYLPEYGCYKNASCERQPDGQCGWTQTSELSQCLIRNRQRSE